MRLKTNLFGELSRRNVFRVAGMYAVVGWLLAQVATTLEEAVGLPAWFDGMVISLLLIGFPIAVVLAWAFEITPEGVKRAADVPIDQSITDQTGRKLDYAILGGLVLLAGLAIWQQITRPEVVYVAEENAAAISVSDAAGASVEPNADTRPPAAPTPPVGDASIAVLPFADLSPESDQGYFADGISEEILNALTRVEGLAVASRTSAFQFKGRDIGIPEIAQTLAVRHVLEGSVRKAGDSLRITAQLIDASNDRHIWSDTYDRPLTAENVFQIQDEIAAAITDALGVAMNLGADHLVTSAGATDDMDAYELYLEARALYHPREELDRADELLGRALEQDPTFARAWELRSPIPTLAIEYGDSTEPQEQAEARSRQYAERALALNPQGSLALASLGRLIMDVGNDMRGFADWAMALDYFERAIEADPNNASAYLWRANSLEAMGFVEEALASYERCVEIEPLYLPCRSNRPFSLMALGRYDEALALHREDLAGGIAMYGFGLVDLWVEMESEILFMTAAGHPEVLPGFPRIDDLYAARLESRRNPGADHSELLADVEKYVPEYQTGVGWVVTDLLLVPLGRLRIEGHGSANWGEPFQRFRRTETFKRNIRDAGILAYWQEHRYPPLCRPVGDDDFQCD